MNEEDFEGRLLEPDIKAMVLNYLRITGNLLQEFSIINEFTIDKHSRRVDLAIATDKHLFAYEIKSEADSLYRLNGQTEKYLEYFDKVIIVAAPKHINGILKTVPKNVAVWEVTKSKVIVKQRGKILAVKDKPISISLMKVSELLKLANNLNIVLELKSRRYLETTLQIATKSILRKSAMQSITNRFNLTTSLFWKSVGDCSIQPKDIFLLSPYAKDRNALKAIKKTNADFWEHKSVGSKEDPYLLEMSKKNNELIFGEIPSEIKALMVA
jgi:hypothetical protein